MRWLSPPDSVPELRLSVRYSSPTLTRNPRRSLISRRMRSAISFCLSVSWCDSVRNQSSACAIDIWLTWPTWLPPILTASASGLSRQPSHASHWVSILEARHVVANPTRVGLAPAPIKVGDHALERFGGLIVPGAVVVGHFDGVFARPEQMTSRAFSGISSHASLNENL